MASTDWTSSLTTGTVAYVIISDGTAPTPPDAMQITTTGASGMAFQNITGGPFKDSAIAGFAKQAVSNGSENLMLCLRSQDNTTFIANPATYFFATFSAGGATSIRVIIRAVVAGVITDIVNPADVSSVNGNPINTWQGYEFAIINNGTDFLFRCSQWNGASFIPIVDAAVPLASFAALNATGSARFGTRAAITSTVVIDNVSYYSIT